VIDLKIFGITFEWWEIALLVFAIIVFVDCLIGIINAYKPTTMQKKKRRS
jgi:hypothetical protein